MSGGWWGWGGRVALVRPRHKCPSGRLAHSATPTGADVAQSLMWLRRLREDSAKYPAKASDEVTAGSGEKPLEGRLSLPNGPTGV